MSFIFGIYAISYLVILFFFSPRGTKNYSEIAVQAIIPTVSILLLLGLFVAISNSREEILKRRREREREAEEEEERREKQRKARRETEQRIISNSAMAIETLEKMPCWLDHARDSAENAVAHYKDGAFSPFWSDIEEAYSYLASYRSNALWITQAAEEHAYLCQQLIDLESDPTGIDEFPVRLDYEAASRALEAASQELEKMTYQAQKHPVFAQIWEQRRTTSAVIEGFTNLETAVRQMGQAITQSITDLRETIASSNREVRSAILESTQGVEQKLASIDSNNAEAMKRLTHQATRTKEELHYQNWGSYHSLMLG